MVDKIFIKQHHVRARPRPAARTVQIKIKLFLQEHREEAGFLRPVA